ncbi:MAG: hypothetical protein IJ979_06970 [Tidjanibacter sp.]|nr:hypothetical protein [Tidjanibacter sp.]
MLALKALFTKQQPKMEIFGCRNKTEKDAISNYLIARGKASGHIPRQGGGLGVGKALSGAQKQTRQTFWSILFGGSNDAVVAGDTAKN